MATWHIDPSHSSVQFSIRHLMITNVRGEFTGVGAGGSCSMGWQPLNMTDTQVHASAQWRQRLASQGVCRWGAIRKFESIQQVRGESGW